jgi:hypothetical protein
MRRSPQASWRRRALAWVRLRHSPQPSRDPATVVRPMPQRSVLVAASAATGRACQLPLKVAPRRRPQVRSPPFAAWGSGRPRRAADGCLLATRAETPTADALAPGHAAVTLVTSVTEVMRVQGREGDQLQRRIQEEVTGRFPEGAVQRVSLLQYGEAPAIEPGEVLVRVFVTPPPSDESGRFQGRDPTERFSDPTQAFEDAHRRAMKKLRTDLSRVLPEVGRIEFTCDVGGDHYAIVQAVAGRAPGDQPRSVAEEATPVMTRLGADDLETLDTLISAGIVTSRAEGVRWALARIRDRPAYGEIRERAEEIARLKTQL